MLRIAVVSLFPEMFNAVTDFGITGRAVKNGLMEVLTFNPRDFSKDVHRTVDDRPYGGGPGMVMMFEPLRDALHAARASISNAPVVYLSPQGRRLKQQDMIEVANKGSLIMIAGRYEGIDERIIAAEVDEEWSIGDYVLSGGELPAMVIIDTMTRLLPGALGNDNSVVEDSFYSGLLDTPHYTRPEQIDNMQVPEVLLSGNHKLIQRWRLKQALGRTWSRRPDLVNAMELDDEQRSLLMEFIQEQAIEPIEEKNDL